MRLTIAFVLLLYTCSGNAQTTWFTGALGWRVGGMHRFGASPLAALVNPAMAANDAAVVVVLGQDLQYGIRELKYSYGLVTALVKETGIGMHWQRSGIAGFQMGQMGTVVAKNLGTISLGIDMHTHWVQQIGNGIHYQVSANVGVVAPMAGGSRIGFVIIDPMALTWKSRSKEHPRSGVLLQYGKALSDLFAFEMHLLHLIKQGSVFRGAFLYTPIEEVVFRSGFESLGWRSFLAATYCLGKTSIGVTFDHHLALGMSYGMVLQYKIKA